MRRFRRRLRRRLGEQRAGQADLRTDAVYAIPQDSGPLMFCYREDLFRQYGLSVPKTWTEFAETAPAAKKALPNASLTTFSSNDPVLFAGLAQQAGAKWWTVDSGGQWTVAVDDTAALLLTEPGEKLFEDPDFSVLAGVIPPTEPVVRDST